MKQKSKNPGYPTLNEFKSKKFLNIATALGIGVSAAAISLDLQAEDKKVVEKQEEIKPAGSEATPASPATGGQAGADKKYKNKEIKDKIILLAANLGNKEFKIREASTKELISLGEKFKKEKKTELTKVLKTEVQKHCKSKDPEVKERAKKILLAIAPPKPPSRRRGGDIQIGGVMIAPQ